MWLVQHKPVYFALINLQSCDQTVKSDSYMSQSVKDLSSKFSNHNFDYNHYSNQFKRLTS